MGLFGTFAGPEFGLDDVKIATLTVSTGNYGSAVDVPSVQMYEVALQTVNAQLEGDDQITDTHAKAISAQVRVRFGSISLDALEVITGLSDVTSDSTPSRATTLTIGNVNFPYFGICGRALSTQDSGDTHVFVPKIKVLEGFTIGLQYGQYAIPELTCMAVRKDAATGIIQVVKHETAVAVTLPPVYT